MERLFSEWDPLIMQYLLLISEFIAPVQEITATHESKSPTAIHPI